MSHIVGEFEELNKRVGLLGEHIRALDKSITFRKKFMDCMSNTLKNDIPEFQQLHSNPSITELEWLQTSVESAISRCKKEAVNAIKAIEVSEMKIQHAQTDKGKLDKLIRNMDASLVKNLALSFLWLNPTPFKTLYQVLSVPELSLKEQTFKQFVDVIRNSPMGQTFYLSLGVLRIIFEMKGHNWSTALRQGLYNVRNMWREDQNETRVGMHLSLDGNNVELKHNTDLIPWEFIPVDNKEDYFIIKNRNKDDRRNGWQLGWLGNDVKILETSAVEWKITPDEKLGKNGNLRYHIRNTYREEEGHASAGMHMGFRGINVRLSEIRTTENHFWEIIPVEMDVYADKIRY